MAHSSEPKWRVDFPIEWGKDEYITRREFTRFLVLTSAATLAGNGFFVLQSQSSQNQKFPSQLIATEDELAPGGVKLFRYPTEAEPALLIRLQNGNYAAYKQRCTHLSCPVNFSAARGRLECPCHNGAFDATTGEVLEGPPPRALPRIALRIENRQIFAEGVIGS